jgi:hypothetical protein
MGALAPVFAMAAPPCRDGISTPDALPQVCAACAHSISARLKLKAVVWHVHC